MSKKTIVITSILGLFSLWGTGGLYAQITTHLDDNSVVFIEKDALYYNQGGTQIKQAVFKNRGKVMIKGDSGDFYKTVKSDNSVVTQEEARQNIGGRFVNVLNEPTAFALPNTTAKGNNYTYGQLFISGFDQTHITGYVQQEHRNVNHGAYQQISLPFYHKLLPSLSEELGKTFTPVRWSQNEILKWNNERAVFDNLNFSQPISDATAYYILGNKNNSLEVSSLTRTLTGIPYTDGDNMIRLLENAGANINFGTGGNNLNQYNEKYNSYLQDGFELHNAIGGKPWQGNYGRNLYQFGNPFLMNIDLRNIFVDEADDDGNFLSNIYGIRVEQAKGTVDYTPGTGGGATSFRFVTWDEKTGSPVGDVDWLIIRPLSVFVIKLKNNKNQTLNFNTLRRFAYTPRPASTRYTPNSAKGTRTETETKIQEKGIAATGITASTVKQLGVIALDENNEEIGRTYYVVSPTAITGHSPDSNYQISASSNNVIGTYEEKPSGGYDENFTSKYWLYINEANEIDFQGKPIPAVIYDEKVKSLQFELRENAVLSPEGTSTLSSGLPFYYGINGQINAITQNEKIQIHSGNELEFQLYYGSPATLNTENEENAVHSKTIIAYNPALEKHIVRFAPDWKSADIEVYDMSGRLVIKAKNHNTSNDYVIDLFHADAMYYVKAINPATGEVVSGKIIENIHHQNHFQ
jgi:hypothetical protein